MPTLTAPAVDSACQVLDWDSAFFGFKIARLNGEHLTQARLAAALSWCRASEVECLYFLAGSKDPATIRLAEAANFHFVDTRATYEKKLRPESAVITGPDPAIRLAQPADVPALRAIARTGYTDSRFYNDPRFPRHLCDRLYETWIEKSCSGYADAVLVAHMQDVPVGYITCHLQNEGQGQIGLVGVSGLVQAKGIGTRLVEAATSWFATRDVRTISVVTQGRNIAAQRLYQRAGFLLSSMDIWYHLWLDEPTTYESEIEPC
ncbi:MAG: GNAT family N-acetyltransferase [Chloroflexia bacterium]